MTIHELVSMLNTLDPEHEVFVALFKADGTGELFSIEAVRDQHSHAQLDISEEEAPEVGGNGAVRYESVDAIAEAADAAVDAFVDLCERRGITEGEKDLIWNAMAMICYEQVQNRQGPFYEAIKPLLAEDDEES